MLITKEQCDQLVLRCDAFQKKVVEIENTEIHIYNYNYATLSDFEQPDYDYDAFEVRGLMFILRECNVFERSLLLHKFFNMNQTDGYMESELLHKPVKHVQDKTDGSVISFVKLNNGRVVARSKTSFTSSQAVACNEIYKNDKTLRKLVNSELVKGNFPIFEYISPSNRVVVPYSEDKLVLLQIRSFDGEYLDLDTDYVHVNKFHNDVTLSEIVELQVESKGIEGWVVTFEDGQMAKFKTNEYCYLHNIKSDFSVKNLKALILNKEIDDVMPDIRSLLPDKIQLVEQLVDIISEEFNCRIGDIERCVLVDGHLSRKDFAIAHKDTIDFNCKIKKYLGMDDITDMLKKNMLKEITEFNLVEK